MRNDAPFVAFYDMHAVTFVPPNEMADVTIAGLPGLKEGSVIVVSIHVYLRIDL